MAIVQQIKVPLLSVNDTSLTVVEVLFPYGAMVKKGDIIMVFETSKTTHDVEAEVEGYVEYLCKSDCDYAVNFVVANIYSLATEVPEQVNTGLKSGKIIAAITAQNIPAKIVWQGETLFSNAALELMENKGIDRKVFAGKDLISLEDVNVFLGIENIPFPENVATLTANSTLPKITVDTEKVTLVKLSSNKKTEIAYLSAVQSFGLTSTINAWIETEGIFVHINQSMQVLKNSLLPVILYEAARLLKKYKALNAYFTGDAIAYYKQVNIGFAIDINKGLKVLKIADTNELEIEEIESEILLLSDKYIDDKLQLQHLTDISFTVTDLSGEGVAFFKPLVNAQNSAILGISSIDKKLNRCMLSLTFDHRVTEGKLAAQFLSELTDRLGSYQSKYYPLLNQEINCFKCFKLLQDDISNVGFAKCITPKGEEGYICQSCLKGF